MTRSTGAEIFICVENEDQAIPVIKNIKQPYHIRIDNNVPSFSKMVNDCIRDCSSDIMIFCSKKVQPNVYDINRIIELVNQGYGYVGLYRFACFGIHKKLINTIGYFDEEFIWGGCEDDDFRIRMNYLDIGFYEDHSVKYYPGIGAGGGRNCDKAIARWKNKYTICNNSKTITINLSEKCHYGELIYTNDIKFKKYKDSVFVKNIQTEYSKNNLHYYKIIDNR
jgi:hypothetical protein